MRTNKFIQSFLFLFLSLNLVAQDCEEFEVAGENCETAPYICDLEGYCSNNYQAGDDGTPNAFCGQVETDVWLAFRAGTTFLELEIEPYDCQNNNGIQAAMFSTSNCNTFTLVSNCFDAGSPQIFILEANNLVVGNTYFIMIDGKGGDRCNFTFNLLNGFTIPPEWSVAGEPSFGCIGEEAVLNGESINNSAAAEFEWITDDGNIVSGGNTLTPTVDTPGTYSLVVTDNAQSCTDTSSTTFTFHPEILLNIPSPEVLNCVDNQTVEIDLEISGVDDPFSFSWLNAVGTEVGTEQTVEVDVAGIYTVIVTNELTGCEKLAETEVFADLDTPVALIDPAIELDCLTDTITLTASNSSQNPDFIAIWTTVNGSIISNPLGLFTDVNSVGTYNLNILNPDNGCESEDEVVVTRNEAEPNAILATVKNPCYDEETGSIKLDSVLNGNPDYLFAIDSSEFSTVSFFENLRPGPYVFTVKDAVGCEYDTTINIVPQDQILVDLDDDFEILLGDSVILRPNLSEENLSFEWLQDTTFLSCHDCETPTVNPTESAYYILYVEDENGCFASDSLRIYVNQKYRIFFPNAFSPNGDGNNDILYLFGGSDVVNVISLEIYDRWGELLFSDNNFLPNDPLHGFDGKHRGKDLNSGALVWQAQVQFLDGQIEWFNGVSHLMR
jgi:gliding motility-associated-like protein